MKHISSIDPAVRPGNGRVYQEPQTRGINTPKRSTLADMEITHPQVKLAVDTARLWAKRKMERQDASLILAGGVGVGKTHIARAILWSVCLTLDGEPVAPVGRFWLADNLIQSVEADRRMADLVPNTLPMVVIDDIGSEQTIPFISADRQDIERQHRYFKLIDYCYTWQISIIGTTNLSIDGLRACIGERAYSRLSEMAPKGFMLELSAVPDYRRRTSGR